MANDTVKQFQELQRRQENIKSELIRAQAFREQKKSDLDKIEAELRELDIDPEKAGEFVAKVEAEVAKAIEKLKKELDKIGTASTPAPIEEDEELDLDL